MRMFLCAVAFDELSSNPGRCIMLMDVLLAKSSIDLLPYRNVLVSSLPRLLEQHVPRHCQDLAVSIWNKMNGIFPSRWIIWLTCILNKYYSFNKAFHKILLFTGNWMWIRFFVFVHHTIPYHPGCYGLDLPRTMLRPIKMAQCASPTGMGRIGSIGGVLLLQFFLLAVRVCSVCKGERVIEGLVSVNLRS